MQKDLLWVKNVLESEGILSGSDLGGSDAEPWFGACIDTRSECADRIFFALKGERTDGHRFVADASAKGCLACVVEDEAAARFLAGSGVPHFRVRSSLEAMQELSRAYRNDLDLRVVAITGSMGKTTTKEYIRAILKKKYRVHSNPGNLNNHIGVPLTILGTDHDREYLICEIAANHAGEIDFLSRLLRPDVGVITNIGDAHIGHFGGRDKIAEAKSEIFVGIESDGYALLPADDDFIELLRGKAPCRVVTFGTDESAAYRVSAVDEGEERIRFEVNGEPVEIRSIGSYNVLNAAAAYAVGELCGVEIDRIRSALAESEPIAGRARTYRGRGMIIIDDSYNANPTSMRAALASFHRLATNRKIAVLGDMAELGDFSEAAHRDLGSYIAAHPVDVLYWFGENGRFVEGALLPGRMKFRSYKSVDDLVRDLKAEMREGDGVLVKASRMCYLDRVVSALVESVLEKAGD